MTRLFLMLTLVMLSFQGHTVAKDTKAVPNDTTHKGEAIDAKKKFSPPASKASADSSSSYSCTPRKRCYEMSSCAEAKYHCFVCGNHDLDRDKDGIPCEKLCGSAP